MTVSAPLNGMAVEPKPRLWTVEPKFEGEDVFVIASGFSLRDQDPESLRGKKLIVINHSYRWAPFAEVWFWMDREFFEVARDNIRKWKGLAVTTCTSCKVDMPRKIKLIDTPQVHGLCKDPTGVASGKTSGHSAINLAYHMGAKRIILLGYDMRIQYGGRTHFADDLVSEFPWMYKNIMIPAFPKIAADLEKAGVPVLNATPNSALEVFPKVDLENVL